MQSRRNPLCCACALGRAGPFLIVCLFVRLFVRLGFVKAAMTTELDYGVGNISAALERTAMWHDTLLIFTSDNGGCNMQTRSVQHTACTTRTAADLCTG